MLAEAEEARVVFGVDEHVHGLGKVLDGSEGTQPLARVLRNGGGVRVYLGKECVCARVCVCDRERDSE